MPCTDAFDLAYFRSLRDEAGENISMKTFLATNQRIPGLGNGVLQDILLGIGAASKTENRKALKIPIGRGYMGLSRGYSGR